MIVRFSGFCSGTGLHRATGSSVSYLPNLSPIQNPRAVDEMVEAGICTTKDGLPMARNCCRWWKVVVLLSILLAPTSAKASDWGDYFWWWPAPRFARGGDYSPMHYWWPGAYYIREYVHPSNLDQYPPGPNPPVGPSTEFNRYCSPSIPPAPSSPYGNPEAYYGRSLTNTPQQPKN
jgi:hypothetical protein